MKLSIITINFRKPLVTLACVDSAYSAYANLFEKGDYELLIVDNQSGDDSIKVLENEIKKKKYKNVWVLAHKENNGFGGGNNYGAMHAKGTYLLFLNNDTILKEGLDTMLTYFEEHPTIGVLGGPLKNPNGTPQSSAGKFYTPLQVFFLLLGLQKFGLLDNNPKAIAKVDWVKGALFMMQKEVFEKMNGFDEKIFMYTEDMELCYRVKKTGKEVYFYPDIDVVHKDQGSSSRSYAIIHIYAGILYFYKKHRSVQEYVLIKFLLQSKALFLILYGKLVGSEYLVTTYEKALSLC